MLLLDKAGEMNERMYMMRIIFLHAKRGENRQSGQLYASYES
jgi:hypothetical protein